MASDSLTHSDATDSAELHPLDPNQEPGGEQLDPTDESLELEAEETPALEGATVDDGQKKSHLPEIPVAEVKTITCDEDLRQVLKDHRQWMEDVLDPKVIVAHGRANLTGQDLRGYDLRYANLSAANLSGANLTGVDLSNSVLSAANLSGAILACANLGGAKLRGAKIEGADFRGADLTAADVRGLDFSRAIMRSPDENVTISKDIEATPVLELEREVGPQNPHAEL